MKAMVWTNPREFQHCEIEDPILQPGEVILRVSKAGICGSELSGYLGENSLRQPPLVMGHEFTGRVVEIAPDVKGLRRDELVAVNPLISCSECAACLRGAPQACMKRELIGVHRPGAFAEYVAVPAKSCFLVEDAVKGTLVEPLACSLRAARQARIGYGARVVVFGAGTIGLFAAQSAIRLGASEVVLVDTNRERLAMGEAFGATCTINARFTMSLIDDVQAALGGFADSVIDAVGIQLTRRQSIDIADRGGRVVWIGLHQNNVDIPGNMVVRKEIEVVGSFCYNHQDFLDAHRTIQRNLIPPIQSWLDVRAGTLIQECFDEQIDGPSKFPKIVLSI